MGYHYGEGQMMERQPRLAFIRGIAAAISLAAVLSIALAGLSPAAGAAASCFGKKATIVTSKSKVIGTKDHDVIVVTGNRRHIIDGAGGHDRICGSPGTDSIVGNGGNDKVDAGGGDDSATGSTGNDTVRGGPGDDLVQGDKGNDDLDGGAGADRLEGLNGDDALDGGDGNDTLVGASGTDKLFAGTGDDVLRGEGNNDLTDGGSGDDIASYSSSSSPVQVDLGVSGGQWTKDGVDTFTGIEDLVGSAFPDELVGNGGDNRIDGGPGYDDLAGGGGNDTAFGGPDGADCNGFETLNNCGVFETPSEGTSVIMSRGLDGDSLVIAGDGRANRITVSRTGSGYAIEDLGPSGVYTGDPENSGCTSGQASNTASCQGGLLNVILVTGGDGDDAIEIGAGVPAQTSVRINGGDGSDDLTGGPGDDVLEAGYPYRSPRDGGPTTGNEKMYGGDGVDSVFADLGSDLLSGGGGTDLLVSSKEVCQGHTMTGGAGKDNASWALVEPQRSAFSGTMRMQLGGTGGPSSGCANLDSVGSDMESLEGSKFADTLIGTPGKDGFLGQEGADTFLGKGGKNYIDARDGERDASINCGGGDKNTVLADKSDPKPQNCPS